ncbi:DUF1828 domain-containing protein [Pseudomonas sp. App30]|uniref:DUF1828 domain-containing protein n=1 Tax=Pseudomonas sp. App30 TaxID=3068990 RepID=UPI003A80503C
MRNIHCGDFFSRAGWHCRPVVVGAVSAMYISSPITMPGGKPLDFYLIPRANNFIEFTDDGITLFALKAIGYPLNDRRNWKSLENLGAKFGFSLTDSGAFEGLFPEQDLPEWGEKIIRLLSAIAAWEEERYSEGDLDLSLTDEVALLLTAKAPEWELTRNATLRIGKVETQFDFLWGPIYVDAVSPVQTAVNARLRKALLINRSDEPVRVLFIIDDRSRQRKADDEIGVLGELAPTIRLTDFEKHYSAAIH